MQPSLPALRQIKAGLEEVCPIAEAELQAWSQGVSRGYFSVVYRVAQDRVVN